MALTLLFHEFKENLKIHNVIINHQRKENEHLIDIYCLEKDNLKKKKSPGKSVLQRWIFLRLSVWAAKLGAAQRNKTSF